MGRRVSGAQSSLLCHNHYVSSGAAHRGAFPLSWEAAVPTEPELAVGLNFLPFALKRSVGCGGGQPGSLDGWESLFVPSPSTMALQQAQMLLSMNSLESVNAGVQQNNTESFAVALCHLAELHAEQVGGGQVGGFWSKGGSASSFLYAGKGHWARQGQVWLAAPRRVNPVCSLLVVQQVWLHGCAHHILSFCLGLFRCSFRGIKAPEGKIPTE